EIGLFVPLSPWGGAFRPGRLHNILLGMSSIVRITLSATRSRFRSSDVLLEKERSLAEKEEEFNELVHLVNNVAQDVAIVGEQCRESIDEYCQDLPSEEIPITLGKIRGELQHLEGTARYLSAGASDIQWLKELSRLTAIRNLEKVEIDQVIEELRLFGEYRAERKNETFSLVSDVPSGLCVEVVTREFLEASLRLLLRAASRRLEGVNKAVEVEVKTSEGRIVFKVKDSGSVLNAKYEEQLSRGMVNATLGARGDYLLTAVFRLAEMSGGALRIYHDQESKLNVAELSLCTVEKSISKENTVNRNHHQAGEWVLLVDDKIQITTFYSRVAQALHLPFETAGSVEEAENIVARKGPPHLVITDIQLGDSSGLDLVVKLRADFGEDLPIIVVSGHTERGIEEKVNSVGATRYLSKPVGRRKLFAEITEILREKN
ncbi:MAG: response regulator, partial [Bdellovibrionales bacterium]|nr:response regulator [Bdellovibrionales bacterium]